MHDEGSASRTVWRRVRPYSVWIAFAALAVVLVAFALALLDGGLIGLWNRWARMHDFEELAQAIRASGNWGVAVSIGLMTVHSFVPFPAEFLAIANGLVYGTIFGTLITWIGAMLGAQAAFWTARSFGRSIVEGHVRADRRARIDRWIAKHGTFALLTMRMMPVIAFNLINYAAGLARVSWWTFTWTTAIGILPLTFLIVAAGDRMKDISLNLVGAILLAGLLLWILFRWLRGRHARQS